MQTTRNVLKIYRNATDSQIAAGMSWYEAAHNIAYVIARGDVWKGAGVLSAYSPMMPWDINVRLAINTFHNRAAARNCLSASADKAQRILDGEHVDIVFGKPTSRKTRAFAHNIATGGKTDMVTIDIHAKNIAMGRRVVTKDNKPPTGREYDALSQAYINAAKREGILPSQMQAITWVSWREMHGIA